MDSFEEYIKLMFIIGMWELGFEHVTKLLKW